MALPRIGLGWIALLVLTSLGAVACGNKCAPPPCPSAATFDEDSCSCVASSTSNGAASNSGGSAGNGSSGSGGAAPVTYAVCQPLDPVTSTVVLAPADVVDAGRAADGTVYVLTDEESRLRVFVGSDASLIEEVALGTGQGSMGSGQFWTANYDDAQGEPVTLEVQQDSSGLRMGVAKGALLGKGFDVGSVGEVLEPITTSDAAAIPTTSTQTYHLEYAGTTADDVLAVVAPDHADSFGAFRVFFGPPQDVKEQTLGMVGRGLSIPSATNVTFTIDAGTSNSHAGALRYEEGVGSLTIDGQSTALVDAADLPANAVFECR